MELGRTVRVRFEPLDAEPAPAEPDVTVLPAEQFDEIVASVDVADPAPRLVRAAAERVGG